MSRVSAVSDADNACDRLADRLRTIRDTKLRVRYLSQVIHSMSATEVAELIALSLSPTELRRAPHPEFHLMLTIVLGSDDPLRHSVAAAAASRGLTDVVRILGTETRGAERPTKRPRALQGTRPLTLGERKALARKPNRDLIARAVRDSHPDVVAILLGNPGLTEDDVVRMCARRTADHSALRMIFQDTRWITRYRVRRALVLNPACPTHLSLPLSMHLTRPDAKLVAQATELPSELREACARRPARTLH